MSQTSGDSPNDYGQNNYGLDFLDQDQSVFQDQEERRRFIDAFINVFGSGDGLYVFHKILEHCGVFRSTFGPDPMRMSMLEGRRKVGLWLLEMRGLAHGEALGDLEDENLELEIRRLEAQRRMRDELVRRQAQESPE